jgi:hypothetical protein
MIKENKALVYKQIDNDRCFCFLNETHYFDISLDSELWFFAEYRTKEEFNYNRLEEIENNSAEYTSIDFEHFETLVQRIFKRGIDTICSALVMGECYKSKIDDFGAFSYDYFQNDRFERFSFSPLRSTSFKSDDEIETVVEIVRKISFGIGPKIEKQLEQILVFSNESGIEEMKVEFEKFIASINKIFETFITPPFPSLTRKIKDEEEDEIILDSPSEKNWGDLLFNDLLIEKLSQETKKLLSGSTEIIALTKIIIKGEKNDLILYPFALCSYDKSYVQSICISDDNEIKEIRNSISELEDINIKMPNAIYLDNNFKPLNINSTEWISEILNGNN